MNEALDVLSNNCEVLEDLKADYYSVISHLSTEGQLGTIEPSYRHFVQSVDDTQKHLRPQQQRLMRLERLLKDRKALVCPRSTYHFIANADLD